MYFPTKFIIARLTMQVKLNTDNILLFTYLINPIFSEIIYMYISSIILRINIKLSLYK